MHSICSPPRQLATASIRIDHGAVAGRLHGVGVGRISGHFSAQFARLSNSFNHVRSNKVLVAVCSRNALLVSSIASSAASSKAGVIRSLCCRCCYCWVCSECGNSGSESDNFASWGAVRTVALGAVLYDGAFTIFSTSTWIMTCKSLGYLCLGFSEIV